MAPQASSAVMLAKRLIARLDVKHPQGVVKGVQMEGLRVIGEPAAVVSRYAADADEVLYVDVVASLYQRPGSLSMIGQMAEPLWCPLTVEGGIRTLEDVRAMLRAGADKVAINTAASLALFRSIARAFGSQCLVRSIQTIGNVVVTHGGRERTFRWAEDVALEAVEAGAGEILVTAIDRDGTYRGCDVAGIRSLARLVPVPLIASGGVGTIAHVLAAFDAGADAVAIGAALHSNRLTLAQVKEALSAAGYPVRV